MVRGILDISARIDSDLGTDTITYDEVQLMKELKGQGFVGHEVRIGDEGHGRVGILKRTVHTGRKDEEDGGGDGEHESNNIHSSPVASAGSTSK